MCQTPHEVFSLYSPMDHWDCIREKTGESVTTYCIPEGQILSFIRDGDRYDCHCDALLSIRMVTDENGDVVLRREFDAWGGELAGSFDSVPGGMTYGFVGGAGCRKDPSTGLVYMRQRWYDPTLQRFISRDPIGFNGSTNLYTYTSNPVREIDPQGLSTHEDGWDLDAQIRGVDYYKRRDPQNSDINEYTNTPKRKLPPPQKKKKRKEKKYPCDFTGWEFPEMFDLDPVWPELPPDPPPPPPPLPPTRRPKRNRWPRTWPTNDPPFWIDNKGSILTGTKASSEFWGWLTQAGVDAWDSYWDYSSDPTTQQMQEHEGRQIQDWQRAHGMPVRPLPGQGGARVEQ